jgi:uncharacterized phiE125 gp8 family phage protein
MPSQLKLITDVTTEIFTTEQIKAYLRNSFVAGTDNSLTLEDSYIDNLQRACREACENFCWSTICEKTWDYWTDNIPSNNTIWLPRGPHKSISGVYRQDSEETETTLTLNSGYYKRGLTDFAIVINTGVSVPVIVTNASGEGIYPVRVRFLAGYTIIPYAVKEAILQTIKHNWLQREKLALSGLAELPGTVKVLLKSESRRTI